MQFIKLCFNFVKEMVNFIMRTERFRFSNGVKVTTVLVSCVLIYAAIDVWQTSVTGAVMLYAILVPLLVWMLFNIPLKLTVDSRSIVVHHPIGKTTILRSEIVELRPIVKLEISGSVRLFGSGGYFGWYGLFSHCNIGRYKMFSGDRENLYLIRTKKVQYIISSKIEL